LQGRSTMELADRLMIAEIAFIVVWLIVLGTVL
jgi:hypothetical protein